MNVDVDVPALKISNDCLRYLFTFYIDLICRFRVYINSHIIFAIFTLHVEIHTDSIILTFHSLHFIHIDLFIMLSMTVCTINI